MLGQADSHFGLMMIPPVLQVVVVNGSGPPVVIDPGHGGYNASHLRSAGRELGEIIDAKDD